MRQSRSGRVGEQGGSELPTDQWLRKVKRGTDHPSGGLYFHYGRYLLVSLSRPENLLPNLRGCEHSEAPRNSESPTNINLQVIYGRRR